VVGPNKLTFLLDFFLKINGEFGPSTINFILF
jgi:hypothetical protein